MRLSDPGSGLMDRHRSNNGRPGQPSGKSARNAAQTPTEPGSIPRQVVGRRCDGDQKSCHQIPCAGIEEMSNGGCGQCVGRPRHWWMMPGAYDPGSSVATEPVRHAATPRRKSTRRLLGQAVDSDSQRRTDLAHPVVAQATETLRQGSNRDALDRIEIDGRAAWDRILTRLEHHLARNPPDIGGARCDQCASKPRDCDVACYNNDRAARNLREFTPPDLSSHRKVVHDDAAASRNEARSPHSSDSSIGCSS